MKKITILALICMFTTHIIAQQKEGEVIYEETIKLDIKIEGLDDEMLKMIPKENKSKKVLYFNETASTYQNTKEDENAVPGGMHAGLTIMTSHADNQVYHNLKTKERIEKKDFMSRTFIIKSRLNEGQWKLIGDQKMVLNYPCQCAIRTTERDTVKAWFTPVIQVPAGPQSYVDLPGLILEVNINNGKIIITAKEVNLKSIDPKLITRPKKGKKVTIEEYEKIVAEKMKEMGADGGHANGKSVVIMKVGTSK